MWNSLQVIFKYVKKITWAMIWFDVESDVVKRMIIRLLKAYGRHEPVDGLTYSIDNFVTDNTYVINVLKTSPAVTIIMTTPWPEHINN